MFGVTIHQGNVNQTHSEILPCNCQNCYFKGTKDKYWQGCGESGTLHTTGRNTNWCRNPTSGYLSKKVEIKISK